MLAAFAQFDVRHIALSANVSCDRSISIETFIGTRAALFVGLRIILRRDVDIQIHMARSQSTRLNAMSGKQIYIGVEDLRTHGIADLVQTLAKRFRGWNVLYQSKGSPVELRVFHHLVYRFILRLSLCEAANVGHQNIAVGNLLLAPLLDVGPLIALFNKVAACKHYSDEG